MPVYIFPNYEIVSEMEPAPPVAFNLTFVCPEGEVFDHDW